MCKSRLFAMKNEAPESRQKYLHFTATKMFREQKYTWNSMAENPTYQPHRLGYQDDAHGTLPRVSPNPSTVFVSIPSLPWNVPLCSQVLLPLVNLGRTAWLEATKATIW